MKWNDWAKQREERIRHRRLIPLLAAAFFGLVLSVAGAEPGAKPGPALPAPPAEVPPPTEVDSKVESMKNLAMRRISPDVLEIGLVRLDQRARSVSFPAVVNMNQGLLEYLLVTSYGKKHESLLRTETQPFQIHVAMLLLNASSPSNQLSTAPASQIKSPGKDVLPGDQVTVEVSWNRGGQEIRMPAAALLKNQRQTTAVPTAAWVYTGSSVWDGKFLAQRDGSVVSLVTDPCALINNEGPGHDDDHVWIANTNSLPPVSSAVQVILTLKKSATAK